MKAEFKINQVVLTAEDISQHKVLLPLYEYLHKLRNIEYAYVEIIGDEDNDKLEPLNEEIEAEKDNPLLDIPVINALKKKCEILDMVAKLRNREFKAAQQALAEVYEYLENNKASLDGFQFKVEMEEKPEEEEPEEQLFKEEAPVSKEKEWEDYTKKERDMLPEEERTRLWQKRNS